MRRLAGISFLVAVLLVPGLLRAAEPLENALGQDTLAVIHARNIADYRTKAKDSGFSRLWNDSEVQAFLKGPFDFLAAQIEALKTQAAAEGVAIDLTLDDLSTIFQGGVVLALENPPAGVFDSERDVCFTLLAEIQEAEKLRALATTLLKASEEEVEAKTREVEGVMVTGLFRKGEEGEEGGDEGLRDRNVLNFAITDTHLLVSQRLPALKNAILGLQGKRETKLSAAPHYQRFFARAEKDPDIHYYLDVEALLRAIPRPAAGDDGMAIPPATGMGPGIPQVDTILAALGLDAVKAAGGWGRAQAGGALAGGAFLYAPGEKKGLLRLFTAQAADMTIPKDYPASTLLYESFRLRPSDIYAFIVEAADKIQPGIGQMIEMQMAMLKETQGIDLKENLLNALGDEFTMMMIRPAGEPQDLADLDPMMAMMQVSMNLNQAMLLAAEVKNAEKLKGLIETAAALAMASNPAFGGIAPETYKDQTIHVLQPAQGRMAMGPMRTPAYAFLGDRLYFAFSAEALKQIIDQVEKKSGGMADHPLAAAAAQKLPGQKSTGIVAMNDAAYLSWYSPYMKILFQSVAAQSQLADEMEEGDAETEAEADGQAFLKSVDFSLWPKAEVFTRHLGFSLGKFYPVEDGILVHQISVPAPAAP